MGLDYSSYKVSSAALAGFRVQCFCGISSLGFVYLQ